MLGIPSDHKTIYVMQKQNGNEILIAVEDEAGSLVGTFRVDHAAKLKSLALFANMQLLVRYDSHREPAHTCIACKQSLPVLCFVLGKFAAVHDAGDDPTHVIFFLWTSSKHAVDFGRVFERLNGFATIERRASPLAHLVDQLANAPDASRVVLFPEVYRTAYVGVHLGATEFFSGNLLTDRRLNKCRSSQEKATAIGHQQLVAH